MEICVSDKPRQSYGRFSSQMIAASAMIATKANQITDRGR